IIVVSLLAVPLAFADRIMPGVVIGDIELSGVPVSDVEGVLQQYEERLLEQRVTLDLRGNRVDRTLAELGVGLNIEATAQMTEGTSWFDVLQGQRRLRPVMRIDSSQLQGAVQAAYASSIMVPVNAGLTLTPADQLVVTPGKTGEGIDLVSFERDVRTLITNQEWQQPISVEVVSSPPTIQDHEVAAAQAFARELLASGITLTFAESTWDMKPFTVRRLLRFAEKPDPQDPTNYILGVQFDEKELTEYLTTTIVPEINQPAQNARFERNAEGRVTQFEQPQDGQELDIPATVAAIEEAVGQHQRAATLALRITPPAVSTSQDIEALGLTSLLATGESDFAGSPANRVHNITVGTTRYHGLLISPGEDFSFNKFLGPVDGAHGFKPELVIKHNVTIPEFGGGLCQVSTTLFRSAIYSGLEITQRRNHAYPVRYYGTPGFDATIYPPYTDLRFTNNTPGYILIQARLEGTKLAFEFWGTDDGREVEVGGPTPYNRQANGAVKATLTQKVVKDGEAIIDETFYSNYKSPDLFPKVLSANDPQASAPAPASPVPSPTPSNEPSPTSKPTPKATPARPAPRPPPAATPEE
ncbi:MAG: VanW family protein, partial [Candidatus Andersenbacteria bacterium]